MQLTIGRMLAPALFLTTGLLVVAADGAIGQHGKDKEPGKEKKHKGKGKDGPEKGAKDLRKAFDKITEIAQSAPAGKEGTRLFDHTKSLYRAAVRAFPDDPRRSRELAVAANDAARGLEYLRRASYQLVANLPEPPTEFDAGPPPKGPKEKDAPPPKDGPKGRAERGEWTPALEVLTSVSNELTTMQAPAKGASRDFFDAARNVYKQGRSAYEDGDYRKAAELARAADAWLRVIEHLERAEWDGPAAPLLAPEPKKKGAPPLPPLAK